MARHDQEMEITTECVPNIGARGQRRRLRGSALMSAATVLLWIWLAKQGAAATAYLAIAPFAAVAALYFFQVYEQTCVVLAARGRREADTPGPPRLAGEWLVAIQRQARKVWIETAVTTVVVTGAAVAFAALR